MKCTLLNINVHTHWLILYRTEHDCTGYMHCTELNNTVQGYLSILYSEEQHCTGYWSTLFSTGQHYTEELICTLHAVWIFYFVIYDVSCIMLPIDKNETLHQIHDFCFCTSFAIVDNCEISISSQFLLRKLLNAKTAEKTQGNSKLLWFKISNICLNTCICK